MPYWRARSIVCFPFLIFLSGCGDGIECDSMETRQSVLQAVSGDHDNALVRFAARTSTRVQEQLSHAGADAEKSAILEGAKGRAFYRLGEQMVTVSTNKRTLTCSGPMSATIDDIKATKDVNFTVQQSPDGKLSVSVEPFQF